LQQALFRSLVWHGCLHLELLTNWFLIFYNGTG
jgi:hypothetical protein